MQEDFLLPYNTVIVNELACLLRLQTGEGSWHRRYRKKTTEVSITSCKKT